PLCPLSTLRGARSDRDPDVRDGEARCDGGVPYRGAVQSPLGQHRAAGGTAGGGGIAAEAPDHQDARQQSRPAGAGYPHLGERRRGVGGMTMATQVEETSRFEQLRKLTEISRALTYTTAVDQILRFATASAADLLHGDRVLLMLLDSDGLLRVSATHGVDQALVERFREPLDENFGTRVQGVIGVSADESFIGVPIVAGGAVKGLLGVVRKGAEPCSDEEEWLLSAVADQ